MTRRIVAAFVVSLVLGVSAPTVARVMAEQQAATPAPPPGFVPPPQPPRDELIEAWLDTAKLAAQLANSQCQQLESVKQFQRIQAETQKRIEARVPGYTVNWQTFTTEPIKRPATPPAK